MYRLDIIKFVFTLSALLLVNQISTGAGKLPVPISHPDNLITQYGHGLELELVILPSSDMLSSIELLGHGIYLSRYLGRNPDGSLIYSAPQRDESLSNKVTKLKTFYIDNTSYLLGNDKNNRNTWSIWELKESAVEPVSINNPMPIMIGGKNFTNNQFTILKINGKMILLNLIEPSARPYWPNDRNPWSYPPNPELGYGKGYDEAGNWLGKKSELTLQWAEQINSDNAGEFSDWKPVYSSDGKPFEFSLFWSPSRIFSFPIGKNTNAQIMITTNVDEFYLYNMSLHGDSLTVKPTSLPTGINKTIEDSYFAIPLTSTLPIYGKDNEGFIMAGNPSILTEYYFENNRWKKRPVLRKGGYVHVQTLGVPQWIDWDADGKEDILAGDASGFLWFIKNIGTKKNPIWDVPRKMEAEGEIIHHQAGLSGSIQGPNEKRWGYLQPVVYDWNGDGLLDIVTNDILGLHKVYYNIGTKKKPVLKKPKSIIYNGKPFKAAWRSKPAVLPFRYHKSKGKSFYLAINGEGRLCLYERLIAQPEIIKNEKVLKDKDSEPIRIVGFAGHEGRVTLEICDFNQDGIWDIVFGGGVSFDQSRIQPDVSVPYSTPYVMLNVGTNGNPVFAVPQRLCQADGSPINLDRHGSWISLKLDKKGKILKFIAGAEDGHFYMFDKPVVCN